MHDYNIYIRIYIRYNDSLTLQLFMQLSHYINNGQIICLIQCEMANFTVPFVQNLAHSRDVGSIFCPFLTAHSVCLFAFQSLNRSNSSFFFLFYIIIIILHDPPTLHCITSMGISLKNLIQRTEKSGGYRVSMFGARSCSGITSSM